eukprot:m.356321 g.356321  ORF g.356321 m.356321 type:complete len:80 (-) comp90136_c0_seq1:223-462(-)
MPNMAEDVAHRYVKFDLHSGDTSDAGYWGRHTSSIDWCERNYAVLDFVAEFWNTVTSLVILFAGLINLYQSITQKYEKR